MTANNDARKRARNKWNAANMTVKYDRINVLAPKGTKEAIAAAAEAAGESISQYMLTATQTRMDKEKDN